MSFTETLQSLTGKLLADCTDQELYLALLELVRQKSADRVQPVTGRKLYYISAEFLIGKLLSRGKKTRVGLTATKKIGHAVQRNRARRVMKAAIDEHLDQNIGGYDLVFVARGMTPRLKSWQLSEVVARLFAQAGLPDKAKQPGAKPPATVPPADRAAKQ